MKKIILCILLCFSGQILAGGTCGEKLSNVETSMGEHQAYAKYADILRSGASEKEELNDSFFGDFLVNDSELRDRLAEVQRVENLVSLKEAIFKANLGMYKSCLLRIHEMYLSEEDLLSDVDDFQVILVKRETLMRILEGL